MIVTLFLLSLCFSDLSSEAFPLDDYFVQNLHGAAQNGNHLAVLNFSQMKTKLCLIDLEAGQVHEIDDPRLKIFAARKVFPYKDGFLVMKNKLAYYVTAQREFRETIKLESFKGRPASMLWYGTQALAEGRFLCRFKDEEGLHILSFLDLERKEFLPVHQFQSEKHHTVYFYANGEAFFALHSKTGSVVEYDATFQKVQRHLPEREPVQRKKSSRQYRRNPFESLIHGVFADAHAVYFDLYPRDSVSGEVTRKRYKLENGKLFPVSDSLIVLARHQDKHLVFDTEEGMFTMRTGTP
ncbi:hypothetical protein [Acanthopleuribacter pedis]|uniref:Uncharacterized protein n=1 Tax=Acanthopleuribacter pedis TaxID=442870 RepID=A0A8J7U172_9BACT|nr:hypothetical protein [Acanthopleuribacter pedis]MBO1317237.1 hypothetical protein [Acanthopleuribacter pedis]MBO1318543.1 hypothetical protein [Acanthopleuribacter pedis]